MSTSIKPDLAVTQNAFRSWALLRAEPLGMLINCHFTQPFINACMRRTYQRRICKICKYKWINKLTFKEILKK
ncbi:hypothetical protein BJF95_04510 [Rhizobium oryziradicis]|uniref:Uncharacterized protein n=1 Tax=Rhizobium oryziradicis TaxID=1867956 RepID=A0A1Q8ZWR9_9HYPH|nr:hypothetical protein BJF95_04510 [Rhizobium oryziradicis]